MNEYRVKFEGELVIHAYNREHVEDLLNDIEVNTYDQFLDGDEKFVIYNHQFIPFEEEVANGGIRHE